MSTKAREEAAKTGELPHEFLLRVSRGEKIDGHTPEFAQRMDAAKAAAPYFAPRLAAAVLEMPGSQKKTAQEMTDEELMERIQFLEEQRQSCEQDASHG